VNLGSGDGPLSIRGCPSTAQGHPKILSNRFAESIFGTHPLTSEPLHPLRSEIKGQAGACPDRTRAIPCTVREVMRLKTPGATADDMPVACPIG
jgi:hypothetical protein